MIRKNLFPLNLQYFAEEEESSGEKSKGEEEQRKDKSEEEKKQDDTGEGGGSEQEYVSEFLKKFGIEDENTAAEVFKKHKEDEEKNLTELEKANKERDAAVKKYVEEHELRVQAEAQAEALKMGAKPELVEDLVVIVKSKMTKEKSVKSVMEKIKSSAVGGVYFYINEEDKNKQKTELVTRKQSGENKDKAGEEEKNNTGVASRLLEKRKKQSEKKKSFWD